MAVSRGEYGHGEEILNDFFRARPDSDSRREGSQGHPSLNDGLRFVRYHHSNRQTWHVERCGDCFYHHVEREGASSFRTVSLSWDNDEGSRMRSIGNGPGTTSLRRRATSSSWERSIVGFNRCSPFWTGLTDLCRYCRKRSHAWFFD